MDFAIMDVGDVTYAFSSSEAFSLTSTPKALSRNNLSTCCSEEQKKKPTKLFESFRGMRNKTEERRIGEF